MESNGEAAATPHAVFLPFPAQGHLTPMLRLAKLLHARGSFRITFVNTEFNHARLVRSRGPGAVRGVDGFRFETIPDGLPRPDRDGTQDVPQLCASARRTCGPLLRELIARLGAAGDPVTCVVADGAMTFAVYPAEEMGIPALIFFTPSAGGVLGYMNYAELVRRGYVPLKEKSYLTNGYLDTPLDWIKGFKNVRLRDISSFIRTTDPDDIMLSINKDQLEDDAPCAFGIILNTFDALEHDVLTAIRSRLPNLYVIGPISPLSHRIPPTAPSSSIGSNLWKEDTNCVKWLNTQVAGSVVYVNFGSITVMTRDQLVEFAWGLESSKSPFLWVVRPDLVDDDTAGLPEEFVRDIEGRGLLVEWCNQEQVLAHPAVGGFLSHCGWNSTLESIYEGVPMICWPFFSEQPTNCRYLCTEWGMGMEIGSDVKRGEVERMVRELMCGEKGREMREKAKEWKLKAREAIEPNGPSFVDLERLVEDLASFSKSKRQ
ncbi:7-deoxyloganetin glucosyltransferase-like [Ananas comosus]|uniref:Glycosyltransferase n=1 Tax=Ananas comosus TaxID=4615 RepID=A0A199VM72_ANACO|nr:7-deoxyloganetin glucosyltransferase-like [Ananas comosus]OAY78282.1 7-deoxyloganetin glucosyltransferase [Ananas comosus]